VKCVYKFCLTISYSELNDEEKKQYIDKVKMINGIDPYFRMKKKSGGPGHECFDSLNGCMNFS